MAEPTFIIKDRNSNKPSLIYLKYRITKPEIKWSTGEKVLPSLWNPNTKRVRARSGTDYKVINQKLDQIAHEAKNTVRELQSNGDKITPKKIKDKLNSHFRESTGVDQSNTNFLDYFVSHIVHAKQSGSTTHKTKTTTLNMLKEFMTKYGYYDFEDIDMDFYHKFINYMDERNYSDNYKGKMIRNIKTVMSFAYDERIHNNDIFRSRRFASFSEEVHNVYLNLDELMMLHDMNLTYFPRLERTRDRFLIACFVGSRFANWVDKGDAQIRNNETIVYESVKVKERIELPLHWIAKDIIQKYEGRLPKAISNQKMNQYLKELGQLAGLDEEVVRTRTLGGKRKVETFKKYELLTTHTARRSLATNLYKARVPIKICMYATGHSSVPQFMNYVKSTVAEEMLESMKSNEFFNKK